MALRHTVSLRRCCRCERLVGVALWPWSGALVVETHTLCDECVARLLEQGSPPAREASPSIADFERHVLH